MISEETTEVVFHGNFVNDLKGATELKNMIIDTANSNHLDQVVIGMEATSIYSFHPAMFFQEDSDLKKLNTQSVVIDPKKTKRYHDVFAEDKNDQIERFDNEAKLAKYAGLSWREKQSGAYASDNTPLKRTGNAYLRYYLVEAANRVRIQDPVFGEYYRRKYQEVKHTPSKRALVLTARKLIRVIFFLLKNHQIYQEKR